MDVPADYYFSALVKVERKPFFFIIPVIGIFIILIFSSYPAIADKAPSNQVSPPDEAFLLFIANLDSQGKQWISPLDFSDTDASNHPSAATNKKSSITSNEESNHD